MNVLISTLIAFLVLQMIGGVLYSQHGITELAAFFTGPEAPPLIILTAGPPIQIVALGLTLVYLRNVPADRQFFVRFVITEFETPSLAFFWEKVSAFLILVLPFAGYVHFWRKFLKHGTAWRNGARDQPVSLMDCQVPISNLWKDFDAYRYGTAGTSAAEGVSFVPCWQPGLLMGGGGAAVLVLTALVAVKLPQRRRERARRVAAESVESGSRPGDAGPSAPED